MQQRLSLITLGVTDLKVATSFYEDQLGWTKSEDSNQHICFFQLNGFQLALYPYEELAKDAQVPSEGAGFQRFTFAHNVQTKQEVDTLFKCFAKKEISIVKMPEQVHWGGYSGYIADPDGHLIEIAFNPFMKFDEHGNVV